MKRQIIGAAAAMLLSCGVASAADLPAKHVYKAPPPMAAVWGWTGFYVGVHIGTGWGNVESELTSIGLGGLGGFGGGAFPISSHNVSGFLGGGQVGYNWQMGWVVLGVEGEISGARIKGTTPCLVILACKTETDWVATLAGRLGVTIDKALVYVKGGVAWADSEYSVRSPGGGISSKVDTTRFGVLLGMGVEYALNQSWSAKIEYEYIDFGHDTFNFPFAFGPFTATATANIWQNLHTVKAGVNYRFGGGAVFANF
jgi:outer membrane immunogenic protein